LPCNVKHGKILPGFIRRERPKNAIIFLESAVSRSKEGNKMSAIKFLFYSRTLQFLSLSLILVVLLPQLLLAQTDWVVFYEEDFEDGVAEGWNISSDCSIEDDNGNNILSCDSFCWSQYSEGRAWKNYSFEAKIKLIQDNTTLLFRDNPQRVYRINIGTRHLDLKKEINDGLGPHDLQHASISFDYQTWHTIKILGIDNNIKIYVDGLLKIDYTDTDAVLNGTIGIETFGQSHFDDFIVMGEPPLPAGVRWHKTGGPHGGLGYDVRIDPTDPNIIYVTDTFAGVCKSTDGGKNWGEINNGISVRTGASQDQIPIFCLTIDPSNPEVLWAGTLRIKGVFKSTDGGESWEMKTQGITTEGFEENAVLTFRDFAIHPYSSDIVFVAGEIEDNIDGQTKSFGVIYKSTDGGDHWRKVLEANNLFRPIDIDPENPNVVYAATGIFDRASPGLEGAFKSTDGGETWFKINNGVNNKVIGFLDRDPSNSKTLYAAAGREPPWGGPELGRIYKTNNSGNSWFEVLRKNWPFTAVVVAPTNSNIVYAGKEMEVFKSTDGGRTWQNMGFNCPGYYSGIPIGMAVDPTDPNIVYLNSYDGGVYKSTNGAESWFPASKGYTGAKIFDLSLHPNDPLTIYAVGRCGTFKSNDGGENWIGLNNTALKGIALQQSVTVDPQNPSIMYSGSSFDGNIYKSFDGGNSWIELFDFVEIDPGTLSNSPEFPTTVMSYRIQAIEVSETNPNIIYVGIIHDWIANDIYMHSEGFPDYGVFKSIDGGSNWIQINNGIPNGYRHIYDLAIHPTDPDIAYAAVRNIGIYKTTDGGNTWQEKNNGLISVYISTITIDPENPETIYAGTINGSGVLKSINGGDTWDPSNTGMTLVCPRSLLAIGGAVKGISFEKPVFFNAKSGYPEWPWSTVSDIVVDTSNSQIVYASDLMFGVYRSDDGATNWVRINEGLSMREVSSLAISDDGKILYAGTQGGGVFSLVLGGN
jgi:photosystem II stability/assembly factor-like uncharacterized protein